MTTIRTRRLVLRPVAEGDLELVLALRNEPRVLAGTATGAALPAERIHRSQTEGQPQLQAATTSGVAACSRSSSRPSGPSSRNSRRIRSRAPTASDGPPTISG